MDCPEHPGRDATAPCVRCGGFICDWCVKLAPSWGAGLCPSCQKLAPGAAAGVPRTWMFMGACLALLTGPLVSWLELNELVKVWRAALDTADKRLTTIATVGIGLVVAVLVGNVVGGVLFFMRKRLARGVLIPVFAVKLVMNVLGAAGQPDVPDLWFAVVWSGVLLAYFVTGDDLSER